MDTKLKWKKSLFSSTYSIYSNDQLIGKLKDKELSKTAYGELDGKKYIFKTKGFFKQHTEIFDNKDNKLIGEITYNNWMTKASILVNNKKINWKYDNLWNTRWSIVDSEGIEIKYTGTSGRGQIDSNSDDPLLILSGLFVINYYWQIATAALIAILIPILIA